MTNFKYIRVNDICDYLGIHYSAVYRKLNSNKLPGAVKFGAIWLIDREMFMEYIKNGGDLKCC